MCCRWSATRCAGLSDKRGDALFSLLDSLFADPLRFLEDALYRVPSILLALILHEWAHGYVAYRLGDPTAKMMGRLSLNPANHLDPLGTVFMLFLGFGWAKPVPVNPRNFKHPRRDDLLVSIAGVTMNLILYALFITAYYALWDVFFMQQDAQWFAIALRIVLTCALINLSLAVFNLLPVPPLDGSHVLNDLVLKGSLYASQRTAQIGMAVLMVASFTGILGEGMSFVTGKVIDGSFWLLGRIFGS